MGEKERKKWDVILFFFFLSLGERQEEEEKSLLFESYYHRYLCPRKQARQESFLGQKVLGKKRFQVRPTHK